MIYERVGTYIRRQICQLYQKEEIEFAEKCCRLVNLFETSTKQYNQLFGCQLSPAMQPSRSLKLIKLFLTKSQLPYEMVYILGKCMQTVAQELAEFYNKQPN